MEPVQKYLVQGISTEKQYFEEIVSAATNPKAIFIFITELFPAVDFDSIRCRKLPSKKIVQKRLHLP